MITRGWVTSHDPASAGDPKSFTLPYNVFVGVLSQYGEDSILHTVASFSTKHSPAEYKYEINEKELMAILPAFEH